MLRVARDELELLIFLTSPARCYAAYVVELRNEPRAFYAVSKHFTNWVTRPTFGF